MSIATLANAARPTLRAVPPTSILPKSTNTPDMLGNRISGAGLSVGTAIKSNILDLLGTPVTPTNQTGNTPVGEAGSANNAGNIAGATAQGNYFVDTARSFQGSNPMLGTALRIGLPVLGVYLMTKGHTIWGGAAIVASAPLWYARLSG